jgi:predicted nucleic acid-binding protein
MIFIDTGAWVAIFDKDDQHHAQASRIWWKINAEKSRIVTSQLVMVETLTLLARRIRYAYAVEVGHRLYASPSLAILRSDYHDEFPALMLMAKWADQKVGFADCISFCLMRRLQISAVFAFDRHFELAGFRIVE